MIKLLNKTFRDLLGPGFPGDPDEIDPDDDGGELPPGEEPYLGCLNNDDIDARLKKAQRRVNGSNQG